MKILPNIYFGRIKHFGMKQVTKNKTSANGSKANGAKKTRENKLKNYEVDNSPTARALMKAFRMTHERLYPSKVKRGE